MKHPLVFVLLFAAFSTYGIPNAVHNLYLERYKNFESGAVVVYNPKEFTEQWGETNVGLNWKKLNEEYSLDTLQTINENWRIYRIR